jgi:uncharacterized membrane protein YfcA
MSSHNFFVKYAIITIIGIVSGILQGSLGSVGIIVIIPALLLFNVIKDFKTACGTLLFTLLFPTSILGLNEYYSNNNIAIVTGILLTITMIIGGYFGSFASKYISVRLLELISGIIFILVGLQYLFIGTNSMYIKPVNNTSMII